MSFLYCAPGKSITEAAAVAAAAAALSEAALAQTSRTRPPQVTRDPFAPLATPLWKTTRPGVDWTCDKPGD